MRRPLLAALIALLAADTPAAAQRFGEDRPSPGTAAPAPAPTPPAPKAPTPTAPPAALPSFPTGAPAATPRPANRVTVAAEPPHEWAVRPEHGEWLICVKSYVGDTARAQAVELADLIRRQHKAATFLFERNAEERQREEQRRADFRAAKAEELAPFLALQKQMRTEAAARGVEYVDAPTVYRMPKVALESQWAVLVGGFKDADTARKALTAVREWPVPVNVKLMDRAVTARPGEGGQVVTEGTYINPYRSAMVVPNPTVKRSAAGGVDPAIFTLNAEEPLSLLKCQKNWTLIVKDFTVPATVHSKDQESSVMARLFGGDESAKLLHSTAQQANVLATALRSASMEQAARVAATHAGLTPRPLDSYILHHRTGSRVTVGQFDGPDDPALLEMQRLLSNMYFQVSDKTRPGGRGEDRRLFDGITPMPVPRKP